MLPARKFDDYVQPAPQPVKPELRVIPGGKDELKLFTCPNQPGNLRLTKTGCETMFKRAQKADLETELSLIPCRECETGSKNANVKIVPRVQRMCVRCERREFGLRLLSDMLCVSCWNRQSEVLKGRNARGCAPLKFKPLNIYDYDDDLIVVARNVDEAGRIVERMTGYFDPETLIDYGQASRSEIATWWSEVKQFGTRNRRPGTYNIK